MVQQYQVKDNSVTLYLNGIAHVATSVQLNTQDSTIQITGITPQCDLETLHPILKSKEVRVLEARVLEPTTLEEFAKSKIGQEVYDRENDENVKVFGIEKDQLLVKASKGVYAKPLTAFRYKTDEDVREKGALELKLEGVGDKEQLKLSYLTEGITLTPHYNIILANDKLMLTAEVEVENSTEKPYEAVELEAIPGNVGRPYSPRGERPRIRRLAAASVDSMLCEFTDVTPFEEGGQLGYAFGKKNLPTGHSKFNVFKTKELDYQIIYRTNLESKRPKINAVLRFKTPITLPTGSVAVYSEKPKPAKQALIERYEGGGAISNPVLKDKDANITLREPDTLETRVEQVGKTEIVKTDLGTETTPIFALERQFKVTAANAGQDDVVIETYIGLKETERILETSLKQHEESSARRVRLDVPIKAEEETTFTYKIQDAQFTPASKSEIRHGLERNY